MYAEDNTHAIAKHRFPARYGAENPRAPGGRIF